MNTELVTIPKESALQVFTTVAGLDPYLAQVRAEIDAFRPDGGIHFEPVGNKGTPYEFTRRPMGTNLFSGEQAEAMFRACIPREYGSAAPDPAPDREAEYRRIWLERAGAIFDKESGFASDGRCDARLAFDAADMFLAELRKRDGEGK